MSACEPLFQEIYRLADRIQDIQQQAEEQYLPVVDNLIRTGSQDIATIEHTLNGLLDFCGNPAVLQLYKRLCRHYWQIDPAATANHINAYREMWDSEPPEDSA
jgi:hypothetical protein